MSDIDVDELSKRYGRDLWALDRVSLSIRSGEIVALVGASGCGKTTLLRCIAGFEDPTGGVIRVADDIVCGDGRPVPPERRRVGIVFQEHALFPHLRIDDNVAFGVRGVPRPERLARARTHLERVGLPNIGRRYPHELSGGQRRRVALARALAPDPRVMLLDEPLTGLDEPLRDSLRDEVAGALREAGATAMWVTHRGGDALAVADRVAALRAGRIVQLGTPAELYARPTSVYVAQLFGPINVVDGTTEGPHTRTALGTFRLDAAPGPTTVGIRPESLWLRAAPNGDPSAETIPARVDTTRFRGAERTARVLLRDGTAVSVRLASDQHVEPDADVTLGVQPDAPCALSVADDGPA